MVDKLEEARARGNMENSSTIVSKYRFRDADDGGPLNALFSFSNGTVALLKFPVENLQSCDLHLAHSGQSVVTDLIMCGVWVVFDSHKVRYANSTRIAQGVLQFFQ